MSTFVTSLTPAPAADLAIPYTWFTSLLDNTLALKQGDQSHDKIFVNDTSNANMTTGITINQGGADDDILALKSTDVAHGITTFVETDTYGRMRKIGAANGGILIDGFSTGVAYGVLMRGFASTTDATRSAAGLASVMIDGLLKSAATAGSIGADKNLVCFRDNGTTRFIFDSDGDSHEDGTGWTAYDDYDDVALIASLEGELAGDQLKSEFKQWMVYNRESLQRARLVTFNDDGHHFVNRSRMQMALCGAVRQLASRLTAAETRVAALGA